jgi:NTP pyrophosphatase (non-canonical NTP hydrolase)
MTNEFIKQLSLSDKKTLSQKALKTCEEVGELAKAILPFDSAHGTNHRFVDREKILEEIADVHLTNISIAYSLGFTDEEITDMIHQKSLKWSELQAKEEKAQFPLPFEIHITVDGIEMSDPIMCDRKRFDLELFKRVCSEIGVKPIALDLEINGGSIRDVMTSSKHFGTNRSAYEESQRIVSELDKCGFDVLRTKIESVPWHPSAPVISTGKEIPNGCYFESHIGIIISQEEKEDLTDFVDVTLKDRSIVDLSGKAKLSQNFFKKSKDGGKFVNMLTYRSNMCGRPKFQLEVETIKQMLIDEGFNFEKVEVEYAIYDTKVTHDAVWING